MRKMFTCLFAVLSSLAAVTCAPGPASAYTSSTDVVFVHGYGSCQDAWTVGAGPLQTQLYNAREDKAKLHAIGYYGCDTGAESIVGYGPKNALYYASPDHDRTWTDIRRFSYELAWYLWDRFGSRGLPVDLVGVSMGGIIITHALQRIAAHDAYFPPSLRVPSVVTFSAPFAGATIPTCHGDTECQQMAPDSAFTQQLRKLGAPQLTGGTLWLTVGSSAGCDFVPTSSSLGLPRVTFALDYTSPCYAHAAYAWDNSNRVDATGTLNGRPWVGAHALAVMAWALL